MKMKFEVVEPNICDIHEMKALWKECFYDSDEFIDYYFNERTSIDRALVIKEQKIVSMLHIIPMKIRTVSSIIDVGFIAGVATSPLYRKRGFANKLLDFAVEIAQKKGYSALILSPVDEQFYLNAGFNTISYREMHTLTGETSHSIIDEIETKPDVSELCEIYRKFMDSRGASFYAERKKEDFELLLHEYSLSDGMVVACDGAYAFGNRKGGDNEFEIDLNEFAFIDTASGIRLMNMLCGLAKKITYPLPCGVSLYGDRGQVQVLNMIKWTDRNLSKQELDSPISLNAYSFELY